MSDRKYKQRGYQDYDRDREPRPKPQGQQPPRDREGPRSPRMMAYREKIKCAACSAIVQANIAFESTCPNCNADFHTCRQCTYFDPGSRLECRKPLTARILNKGGRNKFELIRTHTAA